MGCPPFSLPYSTYISPAQRQRTLKLTWADEGKVGVRIDEGVRRLKIRTV
ncbi:hypothetical protein KDA_00840 [Dictyobacter alpinus]|uniref:Uncharacterized protein n=1 Tax=Dictyobacter alpinus TaxID=2014873 RepID=A0A402AZR3_9CHLR|nr:hypothetical protein KDA_00840 [Dictyobacter alpinus]